MLNIGFKNNYKVVHISNEFGKHIIGGAGTYLNELYKHHTEDTGFIYINCGDIFDDISTDDFDDTKDILVIHKDERDKLNNINCDILVIQFYELEYLITDELLKNKKLVYVVHSVPTPEPPPIDDPFGGNYDVQEKFCRLCLLSECIVCVSEAEKEKLSQIFPELSNKIVVIYNGITQNQVTLNKNYKNSRTNFGYIGRTDYRKGIIEALEVVRDLNANLKIACPKNDFDYNCK